MQTNIGKTTTLSMSGNRQPRELFQQFH